MSDVYWRELTHGVMTLCIGGGSLLPAFAEHLPSRGATRATVQKRKTRREEALPFLAFVDKLLNLLHPAPNLLLLHGCNDTRVSRRASGRPPRHHRPPRRPHHLS